MKNFKSLIIIGILGLYLCSCSTTRPFAATSNERGDKKGTSSNTCLFFLVPPATLASGSQIASSGLCFNDKDYGIKDAADDGNIDKVATVDLKVSSYVLFTKYELIVTGK